MAKLLVSVRNAAEAQDALFGGADLIDVKEPARGALGAADASVIAEVARAVGSRRPVSAALGELVEGHRLEPTPGLRFAKLGLAGCARRNDWIARWRHALGDFPPGVTPVAVAYADWPTADAPDPWAVLSAARSLGCTAMLIDTFDKTAGSLRARAGRWPSCSDCSTRPASLAC